MRGVEIGKDSELIREEKTENTVNFGVGEDLARYKFKPSCYLKLDDEDTDYKDSKWYKGSKILVRKTGHGINACIDKKETYVIQVIYIFKSKSSVKLKDEYVLSILNSKLMHEIYYSLFGERENRPFHISDRNNF